MAKTYKDLMNKIGQVNPRYGLKAEIFGTIDRYIERQNLYRKIIGFSLSTISALSFIPFVVYTAKSFYSSGFYDYVSLIFSDGGVVLNNLGEYTLSLVDSTPFFAITATTFSIFMILVSMRYALNIKKEFPNIKAKIFQN